MGKISLSNNVKSTNKCNICNDYLWILNNNLFCKKCNIEFNPNSLYWKCIICQKKFKSNIKEFNKFEIIEMKNSVKNALINQIIINLLICLVNVMIKIL